MLDTGIKERLCAAVDDGFEAQLAFTSDLVKFASTRGNERGVQDCMADRLAAIGYEVDHWRISDEEIRDHPGYSPLTRDLDQAFNTVGVLPCESPVGRSLIINGHVDTVPAGPEEMWTRPPIEPVIDSGWMYCSAAGDMKSGLVAGLFAIDAIRAAGFRPGAEICVQFVIEQESTGAGTLACLQRGYSADLDVSRFDAAPISHLSGFSFVGQGAFPAQC
ncbi:M20/M25/M40 family metallo-hydrolase [Leisingera sp. F5]|uniref:M20/M25/M40 family metallo-hydrolase n=1 Tax=Leisingera sp. F5 TaxID=1813816 RepID=UPI0025B89AC0|nr:M20/M25/M40 family metallo-hydrolase [Leisingera sp. F5]